MYGLSGPFIPSLPVSISVSTFSLDSGDEDVAVSKSYFPDKSTALEGTPPRFCGIVPDPSACASIITGNQSRVPQINIKVESALPPAALATTRLSSCSAAIARVFQSLLSCAAYKEGTHTDSLHFRRYLPSHLAVQFSELPDLPLQGLSSLHR